ncbi:receptor tyrosine-protein kinase erbB-3-like [Convolutriloba macropyga]|uniref:receptor tyrosine-protein kinase erbB-3-like n=1 Tax=Convolutriloba macropyga TaxID=536237 RepID=UPI003F5213B1
MCPGVINYNHTESGIKLSIGNTAINNSTKDNEYAFHFQCLSECPGGTFINDRYRNQKKCTYRCDSDQYLEGKRCVKCKQEPCEGGCKLLTPLEQCDRRNPFVIYERELSREEPCTQLVGDLILDNLFWIGDPWCGILPFNLSKLHLFKNVREITGQLQVIESPLTNLSFLADLEVIGGQSLGAQMGSSLLIASNQSLTHLGLVSLRQVNKPPLFGRAVSISGQSLCYINEDMMKELIHPKSAVSDDAVHVHWENLPSTEQCSKLPKCDEQCAQVGGKDACWGPGPDMCFKCLNYELENGTCVESCDVEKFFVDGTICKICHEECTGGCHGKGPNNCSFFEHDGEYVKQCFVGTFPLSETRKCHQCPITCDLESGCTGNKSILGDGGCNRCGGLVMIHGLDFEAPVYSLMWGRNNTCEREPAQKITLCPENYFSDRMGIFQSSVFSAQQLCIACDVTCDGRSNGWVPSECQHRCKLGKTGDESEPE